jgi:hypothetical protein
MKGSYVEVIAVSYTCASCGYGIAVRNELPSCPMCRGNTWEPERLGAATTLDEALAARARRAAKRP